SLPRRAPHPLPLPASGARERVVNPLAPSERGEGGARVSGRVRGMSTMRLIVEPIVRAALLEDLGRAGDITTDAVVPADATVEAVIAARQPGVVAGLQAALLAFKLVDPALRIEQLRDDGARIARGETVARIGGRARGVLGAERTALNFL